MTAVTLLAGASAYVAHQAKIVNERKAMLRSLNENECYVEDEESAVLMGHHRRNCEASVPLVRSLLGDQAIQFIGVARYQDLNVGAIREMFPEAEVCPE